MSYKWKNINLYSRRIHEKQLYKHNLNLNYIKRVSVNWLGHKLDYFLTFECLMNFYSQLPELNYDSLKRQKLGYYYQLDGLKR